MMKRFVTGYQNCIISTYCEVQIRNGHAKSRNFGDYRTDLAEELLQTITLPVYKNSRQAISR
jgi:hypothetical protein